MYARHWASACGCVAILRISVASCLTISAKDTGSVTSPTIDKGVPVASSSSVRATTPSTEFSIGTKAKCALPTRTASKAAVTFAYGIRESFEEVIFLRAASVNVPLGPRYAYVLTC